MTLQSYKHSVHKRLELNTRQDVRDVVFYFIISWSIYRFAHVATYHLFTKPLQLYHCNCICMSVNVDRNNRGIRRYVLSDGEIRRDLYVVNRTTVMRENMVKNGIFKIGL